ncbi:hypothetical protein DFA_03070 [Cavenderia fasciculata]|uniref:ATP synthase subunit d, mitochondrial n=1 Tax=Cavenderia fasciculata TaxID=261658 RepID=F4PGJ1_CACFS|nr:uncharacterized protein DFA_03070 [Cavenderia fasciculata]EGG24825.1 hypothetical protein DFA_03070 [Cavenderia fasciculata]|eukprot:XP_004362676.1 hypothetical protein DFA_03070 [Cavenderia fasciculata]
MIRNTLKLLRSAASPAQAAVAPAAVHLTPMEQFLSQENLQSIVIPEVVRPANLDQLPDEEFEVYFEKLMNNPLLQVDPELTKAYRDYENSFKEFENLEILPHLPEQDSEINWEFKKNFIDAHIVDGFKASLEKSLESIDAWEAEEQKKLLAVESTIDATIEIASHCIEEKRNHHHHHKHHHSQKDKYKDKDIQTDRQKQTATATAKEERKDTDIADFSAVIPTVDANLKAIQAKLAEVEDFKNRLLTITMEEILDKNPDIEESVYQDITQSEWMIKDTVGDDTIYNLKHHAGGH